jgi:hypothetical protein
MARRKSIVSTAGEVLTEAAKLGFEGARLVAVQAAGSAARAATETALEAAKDKRRSGATIAPKRRRMKASARKAKKAAGRKTSVRRGSARGGTGRKRKAKRRSR